MKPIRSMAADFDRRTLQVTYADGESRSLPLYGEEALRVVGRLWLKTNWAAKYSYQFTWLGRPVIQLPEDLLRIQALVCAVRPDVIVETGVAHGGSAVFFASLCELLGRGRVISIDIEIRPPNRKAIEAHPLRKRITLIERGSTEPETLAEVRGLVKPGETVLVVLDSNHTKAHVRRELELYSPLVTPGSWIVATDGCMEDLHDVPGGRPEWTEDNPKAAAREFLASHPEFALEPGPAPAGITYWPDAYLRRVGTLGS